MRTRAGRRRIAVDLSVLDRTRSGTAVYARELVRALQSLPTDDVELVCLRGPGPIIRKNKITKALNLLIELLWIHALLPLKLARERIDLVHMPANVAPALSPCPVVVTIHDANFHRFPETYDPGYRRYANLAFRLAVRQAVRVITDSAFSAKDLARYFGANPGNMSVVHLGVSRNPVVADQERPMDGPYVLFVGSLEPHKNVRRLVEAFALFRASGDEVARDCQLAIVGGSGRDYGHVVAEISRHGLEDAVHITGHVTEERLEQLYRHALIFAFPSLNEGFGLPPLEAMARGVPVVAAAAGSLPEVLGDAALYCDPFDPEDIAGALSKIASDKLLRVRLSEAGSRRVEQFTWEKTALATLEIYREVLDR